MNPKEKLKEILKELKTAKLIPKEDKIKTLHLAELVWLYLFEIGRKKIIFTESEKKEIGPLIDYALPILSLEIGYCIDRFETSLSESTLIERSGIEFLLIDYKDFPAADGRNKLEKRLEEFKRKTDFEELTATLVNWIEGPAGPLDFTGPVPDGVPESHHWWPENYFKLL